MVQTWTEKDEKTLRKLLKKRRESWDGVSGYDIKFAENLLEGKDGEKAVLEALASGEVKRDYGTSKSGNVFVEHESWGKSSGITTTEADYWIFLLDGSEFNGEVFIGVSTERLKYMLSKIDWEVKGGDCSKGKLLPIRYLQMTNSELDSLKVKEDLPTRRGRK
jgi:hypothetical protein